MSSEPVSHEATQPALAPTEAPQALSAHVAGTSDKSLPVIDGYDMLAMVGRGGMGRVFKARHRALDRIVAVKMLLDSGDDLLMARFQAEAQAVARLQHPNIAQVFATGRCQGQPFLVLEYVGGGSLAERLAGKPQPPHYAAQLCETLARAVEHSHQHGILHRDLKPGNVLLQSVVGGPSSVGKYSAVGNALSLTTDHGPPTTNFIPKITDFGLAKCLHENSKLTRTGEVVGTPSYMAPEQASGVTAQLGPAVDVYALGAILYEMLTGRPPFQGPDAMQIMMAVLTMEPVPPARLLPRLPRDLETICLKCLEKSPRKRYASAGLLADDLGRFLDGRPIVARPVRAWERGMKWAKRRPWAAAALGLLVTLLFVLGAGMVYVQSTNAQLTKAVGETESANARLQKSIGDTESANKKLHASLADTQESLRIARLAIDGMLVDLADNLDPVPRSDDVRRQALERARKLYERLVAIRPDDPLGRSQAADALGKLASYYHDLGRLDDAEAQYGKALALHRALLGEQPDVADHRRGCANTLLSLANLQQERGKRAEAETLADSALAAIEPLLATGAEPVTLQGASNIYNTLALARSANKKRDAAAEAYEAALKLRRQWQAKAPDSSDAKTALAGSLVNWSGILWSRKDPEQAIAALSEAEGLLTGQRTGQQRLFLGKVQANRAVYYRAFKKDGDAYRSFEQAIATLTELVADHPAVPSYRYTLATVHCNFALYLCPRQRFDEAQHHVRVAGPVLERLVREYPDHPQYRSQAKVCRELTGAIDEVLAPAKKQKKS